jgi:hypothetical protein
VEQLYHETSKSLECSGNADSWADPDEDVFGGVDVDLKPAGFVDRRVEEGEEALGCHVSRAVAVVVAVAAILRVRAPCTHLMGNVRPRLTNVAAHLPHDANVVVAVEEVVLVFAGARAPAGAV